MPLDRKKEAKGMAVYQKYGLTPSYMKRQQTTSDLSELEGLQRSIGNYSTRINFAGQETPEPAPKGNLLWRGIKKGLELWDKPTRAVMNVIGGAMQEDTEDSVLANLKKGWTGEERYEGVDFMNDVFGEADTKLGKFGRGAGGFLMEALIDPTNLLTLGAGSLAKGFATGTAKSLSGEAAEGIAKGLLKNTLLDASDDIVLRTAKELGEELIESATKKGSNRAIKSATWHANQLMQPDNLANLAEKLSIDKVNAVLSRYGSSVDNIADAAKSTDLLKGILLNSDEAINATGKGLSYAGRTFGGLTNARLQDIGAEASKKFASSTGSLGRGFAAVQDKVNTLFNPSYISGLDDAAQQTVNFFKKQSLGNKNLADTQLLQRTQDLAGALDNLGLETGKKQDELIMRFVEGLVDAGELEPAARAVAEQMTKDLKEWGIKEYDSDTLTKMLEGYFPHTTNWKYYENYKKRMELGGINKKLGVTNTSMFRRQYPNIDEANLMMHIRTSSTEAQDIFVDTLKSISSADTIEAFDKALLNTGDVSKAIKRLDGFKEAASYIDELDGIPDFFETSAVKSYISRGLKHNKVIADKDFLDSMKAGFGTPILNNRQLVNARRNGMDVIVDRQALDLFKIGEMDVNKLRSVAGETTAGLSTKYDSSLKSMIDNVMGGVAGVESIDDGAVRSLISRISDASAPPLIKLNPEEYMLLANTFPVEAWAMPRGTIDTINQYAGRQTEAGWNALGGMIDWIHSKWKPTVTGLRPDYHIRNLVGSSEQNIRNIGLRTIDPQLNNMAAKVASSKGDDVFELAGQRITAKEIREAMVQTSANATFMQADPTWLSGEISSNIVEKLGKPEGILGKANKAGRAVGNRIEDQVRAVNFLANTELALEKGLSKTEAFRYAGEMVAQFHFDYSDLTKFEKDVMKRIMPFYTFAKKNLGLQFEQFLNDPTYYNLIPRLNSNMNAAYGVDDSNQPEWFANASPISAPFLQTEAQAEAGRTPYLNFSLPSSDINETDALARIINMLSPAIKTPIELHTGSRLFNNSPIERFPGETTEVLPGVDMNNRLLHVLSQFGVLRDISRVTTANDDPTQSVVGPITDGALGSVLNTLRSYSPERAEIQAGYDYERQLANEIQKLRAEGVNVLDMNTINAITEDFPQFMRLVQQTGEVPWYVERSMTTSKKRKRSTGTVKGSMKRNAKDMKISGSVKRNQ